MPNASAGWKIEGKAMGLVPKIRVLHYLFKTNKREKFIAHCLNFDIVTSADTREEAERRLDMLMKSYLENLLRGGGICGTNEPAPQKFWDEYTFALQNGGALPSSTLRIEVPEMVPMEMPYGMLPVVAAKAA
jgi:hypothetical protein